jgi:hypothetical protein
MGEGVRHYKVADRRERKQLLLSKNNEASVLFNRLEKNIDSNAITDIKNILEELFAEEINLSSVEIWLDRIRNNQTSLEELKYDRFHFPEFGFNEFS